MLIEQFEQANTELQRLSSIEYTLQADRDGLARHAAALEASRAEGMAALEAAVAEAARLKREVAELAAQEASRAEGMAALEAAVAEAAQLKREVAELAAQEAAPKEWRRVRRPWRRRPNSSGRLPNWRRRRQRFPRHWPTRG